MRIRKMLSWLYGEACYETELCQQLLSVTAASVNYGMLEAWYIPTSTMAMKPLPYIGHFAWYHLFLVAWVVIASFGLAVNHIHLILTNRKKYMLLMGVAGVFLSLLIEDITWFLANKQIIKADEWTMIFPYLGINLFGWTWLPLWYFVDLAIVIVLYKIAGRLAEKGYQEHLRRERADRVAAKTLLMTKDRD